MRTIVVFGATGKVGCYTALHLQEKGYKVIAVGKRKSDNGFFADNNIEYMSVDILSQDSFKVLPQSDVYGVVHMAAILPARMESYNSRAYVESNIYGTMNVLDYAVTSGVQRFVFPRTWADVMHLCGSLTPIAADTLSQFPINDDHTIYAITKNAACDIIKHYAAKYNFKYYILRFPNIFCYHPNPTYFVDGKKRWKGQRLIIEQAKRGMDIELWGNPDCARDVFYVKDCVQIIEKMMSGNGEDGVYNVGTGKVVTRYEQIKGIVDVFGDKAHPSKIVIKRDKPDSPFFLLDISKTIQQLGYEPHYDYKTFLLDLKHEMEMNRFEKLWGRESDYTQGLSI